MTTGPPIVLGHSVHHQLVSPVIHMLACVITPVMFMELQVHDHGSMVRDLKVLGKMVGAH